MRNTALQRSARLPLRARHNRSLSRQEDVKKRALRFDPRGPWIAVGPFTAGPAGYGSRPRRGPLPLAFQILSPPLPLPLPPLPPSVPRLLLLHLPRSSVFLVRAVKHFSIPSRRGPERRGHRLFDKLRSRSSLHLSMPRVYRAARGVPVRG